MHVRTKFSFASTAAVALVLLSTSAHAQVLNQPGWKIEPWRPDGSDISICLMVRPGTGGLFKQAHWDAKFDLAPNSCNEVLRASIGRRSIFIDMKDQWLGGYQAGQADADCNSVQSTYNACTSSFFFSPFPESRHYRKLNIPALAQAINETGILATLETQAVAKEKAASDARLALYRAEFEAARTPADVHAFARTHLTYDPENLVQKAFDRLEEQERQDFASATTSDQLQSFVSKYRDDDLAKLLAAAYDKLSVFKKAQAAVDNVRSLENTIRSCRRQITQAQQTIAREEEIAAISGTKSLSRLHNAGETIVSCRQAIPNLYASYRKAGGKLALEAIQ